jgi:hypothetical protein
MSDPDGAAETAKDRQEPPEASADEELTARQERAILALLWAPRLTRAARRAEVGVSTLRGWLRDREFMTAYRLARREIFEQSVARLQRLAGRAVSTLRSCLAKENKTADRIRAAVAVLALGAAGVKHWGEEERLVELERTMKEILARQQTGAKT